MLAAFCCSGCILRVSRLAEVTLQISFTSLNISVPSVTATFLSSGSHTKWLCFSCLFWPFFSLDNFTLIAYGQKPYNLHHICFQVSMLFGQTGTCKPNKYDSKAKSSHFLDFFFFHKLANWVKRNSSKSGSTKRENYNGSRGPRRYQQTHTKPLATCILVVPLHVKPLIFILLSMFHTQFCCTSFLNLPLFHF